MKLMPAIITLMISISSQISAQNTPLKIGVAGLTHGHVHWILGRAEIGDIEIVGISEPNADLADKLIKQYNLPRDLIYTSLEEMVTAAEPEAVTAFGSTYDHLEIVEICAPKGIHVMVEKPLAVSLEHAKKMASLALQHNIHLLTNYETTWYPSNHEAYRLLEEGTIGDIRKVVIRDGHKGPKKIGVNAEFLEWLTDPKLNGGGAMMDFGCYGANLITWLQRGEKPLSVTAVFQQLQPENNLKVDDDATIILNYYQSNAIIQASWNWPIGRKDMEIYGLQGVIYADNGKDLRIRISEGYDGYKEKSLTLPERAYPLNDPFSLLASVVRGNIILGPYDLSSLENNMIVMEILDAALRSARTDQTIYLDK